MESPQAVALRARKRQKALSTFCPEFNSQEVLSSRPGGRQTRYHSWQDSLYFGFPVPTPLLLALHVPVNTYQQVWPVMELNLCPF